MVAVAIGGAAVVGAGASIVSGNKAAKAQKRAADQSVAESRRQYDLTRSDYAPWREAGVTAIDALLSAYGLRPRGSATGASGGSGAYGGFFTSPGYEFRRDEGLRAIDRSNSARGRLNSGAADRARMRYADNLASSEYDSYTARLAQLAGLGQSATAGTAAAGENASSNISNALIASGNARASSYANTGSAINSGLNNIMTAYLMRGAFNPGGGGF